jgi:hypothetical protein
VERLTLIFSELVSNAVRHGKPPIQLSLQRVGRGVRVDVHDEAPEAALTKDLDRPATLPGPDAEGERGRFLVDALSTWHGVNEVPDDGKEVWAVIEPDRPQDRAAETGFPQDSLIPGGDSRRERSDGRDSRSSPRKPVVTAQVVRQPAP